MTTDQILNATANFGGLAFGMVEVIGTAFVGLIIAWLMLMFKSNRERADKDSAQSEAMDLKIMAMLEHIEDLRRNTDRDLYKEIRECIVMILELAAKFEGEQGYRKGKEYMEMLHQQVIFNRK